VEVERTDDETLDETLDDERLESDGVVWVVGGGGEVGVVVGRVDIIISSSIM